MNGASKSLLSFLEAPVVIGDPDGRAAYVNPAFAKCFGVTADGAIGQLLAALFDGGVREAVLVAVAQACEHGETVRFRLRHAGIGYAAVASPIVAEDARVGVVIVLVQTSTTDERLLSLQHEIHEPLDDLLRVLDEVLEQSGGSRSLHYRELVEEGLRAIERVRKWSEELQNLLAGRLAPTAVAVTFDPARVVRDATSRVAGDFAAQGIELEARVPESLPAVVGDAGRVELLLVRLLRSRLRDEMDIPAVTISARTLGRGESDAIVLALVDAPGRDPSSMVDPGETESEILEALVEELGGELRTTADPLVGRTTALRIDIAPRSGC